MKKLSRKLVSVITMVAIMTGIGVTSSPATEVKAGTMISSNSNKSYVNNTKAVIVNQIELLSAKNNYIATNDNVPNTTQTLKKGVYFKKPAGWGTPTCYVYDDSQGTVKKNAAWPGIAMIDDGDNGYYYEIPDGIANPKVIFASGNKQFPGANQAGHAYTLGTALICDGQTWKEEIVSNVQNTTQTLQEGVYFKKPAGWGTPTCYVYDDSQGTVKKNASWPGVPMIDDGENGYYYQIPEGMTNPKVMFASGNNQFPGKNQPGHVYTPGTALICDGQAWKEEEVYGNKPKPVITTEGVYLKKSAGFGAPTCYVYDDSQGTVKKNASWPGVPMIDDGENGYYYKIPEGFTNPKVMFASGNKQFPGKSQPGHVYTPGTALICDGQTWKEEKIVKKPVMPPIGLNPEGRHYVGDQITIGLEKIVICDQKNSSDCFPYLNVKYYPYFKFEINSKVISDFSNKDSVNWIPTEPGTYEIKVIGRDDNGNTDISTRTIVVEDKIVFPKIVISPNGPYYEGSTITFTLDDKGDNYKFSEFMVNSQRLNGFSETSKVNWTPTKAGSYDIIINIVVRQENGMFCYHTSRMTIVVGERKSVMPKIVISPNAPYYAGTPLTISLVDKDLTSQEKSYKYFKYEVNSKVVSDFSETKNVNWTPIQPGTYSVKITGKDENGSTATIIQNITVENLDLTKFIDISPKGPLYVGKPITVSLKNVVITPELINKFKSSEYYKKIIASKYYEAFKLAVSAKIISVSYTNMSVTWTPTKAGSYSIPVPIIDAAGNITTKNISIKIENPIK